MPVCANLKLRNGPATADQGFSTVSQGKGSHTSMHVQYSFPGLARKSERTRCVHVHDGFAGKLEAYQVKPVKWNLE